MSQLETLFEAGEPAWRLEIRIKAGGGPFDPAGFSIYMTNPKGGTEIMTVHGAPSAEHPVAQLAELLAEAVRTFEEMSGPSARREASRRRAR